MTSLAGGVQAVDSGELLESLRGRGTHGRSLEASAFSVIAPVFAPPLTGVSTSNNDVGHSRSATRARNAIVRDGAIYLVAKRAIDIVGSVLGLLLFSPIIAVAAIITKLSDGGSIFYPHTRVGKWGREFRCLKFRTMVVNADLIKDEIAHLNTHDDHRTFKVPDDPRVTRIGRWLRRASIDEVPQLWNVLRGDMSLVGPRPPVPQEVERYDLDDMQRLMIKPGLTCIWQVSGRSRLPFPEQLAMDMAYIERRGFWFDLKLMALTVPAVLSADGAY
jgi:lipopolysaccharide/colanic/teichoic acid biosynthesis glycosyltransferase